MTALSKRLTKTAEAATTGSIATEYVNSSNSSAAMRLQGCNNLKSGGRFTVVGRCLRFFYTYIKVIAIFFSSPIRWAISYLPLTVMCSFPARGFYHRPFFIHPKTAALCCVFA